MMMEVRKLYTHCCPFQDVNYLFPFSFAPTGHQWNETHDVKANKGQAEAIKAWVEGLWIHLPKKKKKYTIIKPLSAEADRFISGATLAQQACIYLPCTHAGCANSVLAEEKAKGIMTAKIIVYWFGAWSESGGCCGGKHCLHGEAFVSLWSRWCCAQMFPPVSQDVIHNYTSSGQRPEPSGVSRGAD